MRRFNCTLSDKRGFEFQCMEKNSDGKFVLYREHANKISQLESKIKKLQSKLNK